MLRSTLAAATLAVGLVAGYASATETTIKFSHVVAETTPKGQMALKFKELVEERLSERVKVEVFPNSQLYQDEPSIPALLLNDIQMIAVTVSVFDRYTKQLQLFDLPFLFEDMEAVGHFQQTPEGQALLGSLDEYGFVGLGFLHNGMKQLTASRPLIEPSDVEGLKFRVMESDVLAAQFDALRAIPVKRPLSEVFTMLQTKAIDGQENTWSNIYSLKFHEAQPHITHTNHGVITYIVLTSADFWNGLPEDVRDIIDASVQEAIAYGNNIAREIEEEAKMKIESSGYSTIHELTPEQRAEWVEALKPVWEKFEDDIGLDLNKVSGSSSP